ncbi:MAG: hypothetical protein KDN22_18490 [Verrucomicrobiae bacterium]|nr:hypothetical protein [Verrucomicrobiae bacterium]
MRTIPLGSDKSPPAADLLALIGTCVMSLALFSCGPQSAPDSKRRTVDGHFARAIAGQAPRHGSVYSNKEIEVMRARLALNPKDINSRQALAEALSRIGKFPEALSELDTIESARPLRFETAFQRAVTLEQSGDLPGALAAAEQAVKLQSSGHVEMGDYFLLRLRWQLNRQNGTAKPVNFLGIPYDSDPKTTAESPRFRQHDLVGLLEFFPQFFDGHVTLGDWMLSQDNDQLAARAYVRALQLAPEGEDKARINRRLHILEEKWQTKAESSLDFVFIPDYRERINEEFVAVAKWLTNFELLEQSLVRDLVAPPADSADASPTASDQALAAIKLPTIDEVEKKLKLRNDTGPAYYHVGLVPSKPSPWRIITGASPYMWALAGALTTALWLLWRKVSRTRARKNYRL